MRGQKLKTFSDFLKRTEIIPQALLIITKDGPHNCIYAKAELKTKIFDIPFYELNLSDNLNLREELSGFYDNEDLPTLLYFRGNQMISKVEGFDKLNNIIHILSEVIELHP